MTRPDVNLELIQGMLERVIEGQRQILEGIASCATARIGAREIKVAALSNQNARLEETVAHMSVRLDRMNDCIEPIERRLGMVGETCLVRV